MAYLSVNTCGYEYIHDTRPTRKENWITGKRWYNHTGHQMEIPKGTIKKLIGRDITFEDGPMNLKIKN